MLNATAVAPERATKARSRSNTAAAPLPVPASAHPEANAISADERAIASTGAALLGQAVSLIAKEGGSVYAMTLLEFGQKMLHQACENALELCDVQDAFFYGAGACAGALAIEQRDHPTARQRHELIDAAYQVLNNAGLSYDNLMDANEVAAAAIEATARQFRDRPAPPVRRMEEAAPPDEDYSHAQLKSALEFVAGAADSVRNVLMLAQTVDERWEARQLVEAAELMVRQIGASADVSIGGEVIGGLERWNYGPNFAALGKAGEA